MWPWRSWSCGGRTKRVSARLIVESINGYLLLGLTFALLVTLIATSQPDAYSAPDADAVLGETADRPSDYTYYAFVTFSTLGYGDMLPTSPQTKSLAILMSITGQLYLVVILAMLVGKFSSSKNNGGEA